MTLAADNLTVRRGTRTVLDAVSLRIAAPGCLALVGPNGAGKTTLLQTLLGLIRPIQGHVQLDGRDVRALRRRDIARRIAYVPQNIEGFPEFTVEQIVAAARFPHLHRLEPLSQHDLDIITTALRTCGLTDLSHRLLGTLSGGERQRVWIAAALAQDAPLMLLDEPAAALDPKHQLEFIKLIRSMAALGRTLVVVAHDLNLASALAERIVALRDGRILFDGPTATFLSPGTLAQVFDTTFELTTAAQSARTFVNLGV